MRPKKISSARHSAIKVKNAISKKLDPGYDPETEGDDIYEQLEDIDPEELLDDFGSADDDEDLY